VFSVTLMLSPSSERLSAVKHNIPAYTIGDTLASKVYLRVFGSRGLLRARIMEYELEVHSKGAVVPRWTM